MCVYFIKGVPIKYAIVPEKVSGNVLFFSMFYQNTFIKDKLSSTFNDEKGKKNIFFYLKLHQKAEHNIEQRVNIKLKTRLAFMKT